MGFIKGGCTQWGCTKWVIYLSCSKHGGCKNMFVFFKMGVVNVRIVLN